MLINDKRTVVLINNVDLDAVKNLENKTREHVWKGEDEWQVYYYLE